MLFDKISSALKKSYQSITRSSKKDDDDMAKPKDAWEYAERYRYYQGKRVNYKASRLEPWIPFLQDKSLKKTVLKSRKVTASEQFLNEALFWLEDDPWIDVAYAMPTVVNHAKPFVLKRVNPAIEESPHLKNALQTNSIHLKSFKFKAGRVQFIRIDGVISNTGEPGDKFRGDILGGVIYDEVQIIPEEAHGVIDAAKKPDRENFYKICGGTPTTPGNYLNSDLWEKSDQKLFLLKCPSCGLWQHPTIKNVWYHNYNPVGELHPEFYYPLDNHNKIEDAYLACERSDCRTDLEPLRGTLGKNAQWVQQVTDRHVHSSGYFFSKFMIGLMRIPTILADLESPEYTTRQKINEILGRTYAGDDAPFSTVAMKASLLLYLKFSDVDPTGFDFLVATVDWGLPSWYAVHGGSYVEDKKVALMVIDIGHTPFEYDERKHGKWLCHRLKSRWPNVDLIIYDEGYSVGRGKDFFDAKDESEKFEFKKIFAISSTTGPKLRRDYSKVEKNINVKEVRKTHLIKMPRDALLENFEDALDPVHPSWFVPWADKEKTFDGMVLRAYIAHCENVYRQPSTEYRDKGKKVYQEIKQETTVYYKDTGSPDHSLMLFSYASILLIDIVRRLLLPYARRISSHSREEE